MHIELVRRLAARQHHDEAVAVAVALIDRATVEPGRRDAMHALRLLSARSLMALQHRDRALTVLTEGLDEPGISDGQRAALQATLAELHWFVRDTEAVLRHAGSALDLAAADPDPGARIDALCILSSAASLVGDVDLALAHADEAATLLTSYPSARGAGTDPVGRRAWTVGLAQGTALVGAGRFDDGLAILAPSLRQVEREGDMVATVLHQVVMQGSRLHIGEWDGFVADADAMSEFARETGHRAGIVFPTVLAALVAMRRGDHPLARELMARAAAEMTRGDGHPAAPVGLLLADVVRAELDGEHARAATLASQLVQLLEPVGYTTQLLVALDAARLAWIVSDRPTLDLVAACTARGAARSGTPTRRAIAQYCDALAGGQAHLLAAAAHAMDSTQRRWDAAVAFHIAGLAAKPGDMTTTAPAEALLDKASDRYAALGCSGLAMAARRGEAMLRPGGAASPSAASVLIAGTPGRDARLSGAERRVLELVAAGRSNAEIAGDLFVTKRTVESHLSALYRKLGISTRVALGAAIATRP